MFFLVLLSTGLIVAIPDDGLPPHDADEDAPVIHHRHKVLVHGCFDQLIHAGGHGDGLVVPFVGKSGNGHILSRFQIQPVVFFQTPENIALGQSAHIFALTVEHRNGGVAVILPLFQCLPKGEIVVNVHQILLGGKEEQNIHDNSS